MTKMAPCRFLTVLMTAALIVSLAYNVAGATIPQAGAASVWTDGPTMLYGRGLSGDIEYYLYGEYPEWKDAQLLESLQRLLDGKELPLNAPEKTARWTRTNSSDDSAMMLVLGGSLVQRGDSSRSVAVYLRSKDGTSQPYLLNMPEIWGASPARCRSGDMLTVWGVNLARQYALADSRGKAVAVISAFKSYGHSMRHEALFYNILRIPGGLAPGRYRLYNWSGMSDAGWSCEAATIEVMSSAAAPSVYRVGDYGAYGDGVTDDARAIQKALDEALKNGGGRVLLAPGRYAVSRTIQVPPGVVLAGVGRESVSIRPCDDKSFRNAFQWQEVLEMPPLDGVDPEKNIFRHNGKEYIARTGYQIDWLPELEGRNVLLQLRGSGSGIEGVTLSSGNDQTGFLSLLLVGGGRGREFLDGVSIQHCRFMTAASGREKPWPEILSTDGIYIISPVRYFNIDWNEFRVNAIGITFRRMPHWDGSISFNEFRPLDPHVGSISIAMGGERNIMQGNIFENTGRGKTGANVGDGRPVWRNLWLHNVFSNLRKSDGEMLSYEGGAAVWSGSALSSSPGTLKAAPALPWKRDEWKDYRVHIASGPGMGQIRWITGNDESTLKLDREWLVIPDKDSRFMIESGISLENLHIGNDYLHSDQWSGLRSGVRNIWVDEIMDQVGGGHYAWVVNGPASLNLHLGNKYHDRGRLVWANGRYEVGRPIRQEDDIITLFGNEARHNTFRRPSYQAVENRPDGGIYHARNKIVNPSFANPIQPRPGEVAGLSIFSHLAHTRAADPEDPRLDSMPPQARWNLIADNLFQECPVGVYIGKGVADTILVNNTYSDCRQQLRDRGKNTLEKGAVAGYAFDVARP